MGLKVKRTWEFNDGMNPITLFEITAGLGKRKTRRLEMAIHPQLPTMAIEEGADFDAIAKDAYKIKEDYRTAYAARDWDRVKAIKTAIK